MLREDNNGKNCTTSDPSEEYIRPGLYHIGRSLSGAGYTLQWEEAQV